MRNKMVASVEKEYMRSTIPSFRPGDTVRVNFRIVEGNKERIQAYEGLVIALHRSGVSSTFKVRKMVGDIGVERTFPTHSPRIESVKVVKSGRVRRAKLYYMRALKGKAARLKERIKGRN